MKPENRNPKPETRNPKPKTPTILDPIFPPPRYPQFAPAVLAEQSAILARHGPALNYAVLGEMECLQRVIKEALRLNPPLIMLLRYNHRAFTVDTREGATYTIPKGHIVATSPYISNRWGSRRGVGHVGGWGWG